VLPTVLTRLAAALTGMPLRLRGARIGAGARISPLASFRGGARRIAVGPDSRIGPGAVLATTGGGEIRIGARCAIHDGALLMTYGGAITVGDDCSINPYCVLYGHGGLTIGDQVRIAAHVVIIPANHRFERRDVPIMDQGMTREGVRVADDVWIGAGARILDGCTVGRGAVVAAGAVVTEDVPPWAVVGGVPARVIGTRGEAEEAAVAEAAAGGKAWA